MKAIILAGGMGTRLKQLTDKIPKAMISIGPKNLTEHVIDILKKDGIKEVYLSVSYKKEIIKSFFKNGQNWGINIEYIDEDIPLGTAGPLIILNQKSKPFEETFIMLNGDNLMNINLKEMIKFHKKNNATVTIALTTVNDPTSYGVALMEGDMIKGFIEKPKNPPTNLINSGYYIMEPEVFNIIRGKEKAMIEKDIFPVLAREGKLFGYKHNGMWFDTGTPERYEQVKREWKNV